MLASPRRKWSRQSHDLGSSRRMNAVPQDLLMGHNPQSSPSLCTSSRTVQLRKFAVDRSSYIGDQLQDAEDFIVATKTPNNILTLPSGTLCSQNSTGIHIPSAHISAHRLEAMSPHWPVPEDSLEHISGCSITKSRNRPPIEKATDAVFVAQDVETAPGSRSSRQHVNHPRRLPPNF